MTTATATAPAVTRAVLIDRLNGLLYDRRVPHNPSGLQDRLDAVLSELVTGVSRCSTIPDDTQVQEAMERAIYDALLDGIETEGLGQPEELSKYGRVIS